MILGYVYIDHIIVIAGHDLTDFLQSLAGYNDLIVRVGFLDIHSANRNSMTVQ